jgi:hypothetical protein
VNEVDIQLSRLIGEWISSSVNFLLKELVI